MRANVYDDVQLLKGGSISPVSISANGETDGASVDTLGGDNAAIYAKAAAASGSPSGASFVVKVQESADGSTNWTDALDNTGAVIGFTLDAHAAAAENVARIEGLGLNRQRYLRAVVTATLTGGSSPAAGFFAAIIIGNAAERPVDTATSNT